MNILHVIDSGGFYGAEAMLLDLMIAQKKVGINPVLCSMGTPDAAKKEIERRAERHEIQSVGVRFRKGLNPAGARQLLQVARTYDTDIFHSHGYKGNILLGAMPKFIRKIPLLCTLHGWTNTRRFSRMAAYEWLDRLTLPYKDAIVLVNDLMLNDRRITRSGIPRERIFVINNGISPALPACCEVSAVYTRQIKEFSGGRFTIGAIGRLSREKGYAFLLQAVSMLVQQGHDVRLVVAGDGPLMADLKQEADSLGLGQHVLFTGYVPDASCLLDCLDILAISSLSEGLPITLLEAMRERLPVVATHVGGIPDVIEDGVSGLLAVPSSPAALYEKIRHIMQEKGLAERLTLNAYDKFKQYYSSDIMAARYLDIYRKLETA